MTYAVAAQGFGRKFGIKSALDCTGSSATTTIIIWSRGSCENSQNQTEQHRKKRWRCRFDIPNCPMMISAWLDGSTIDCGARKYFLIKTEKSTKLRDQTTKWKWRKLDFPYLSKVGRNLHQFAAVKCLNTLGKTNSWRQFTQDYSGRNLAHFKDHAHPRTSGPLKGQWLAGQQHSLTCRFLSGKSWKAPFKSAQKTALPSCISAICTCRRMEGKMCSPTLRNVVWQRHTYHYTS